MLGQCTSAAALEPPAAAAAAAAKHVTCQVTSSPRDNYDLRCDVTGPRWATDLLEIRDI